MQCLFVQFGLETQRIRVNSSNGIKRISRIMIIIYFRSIRVHSVAQSMSLNILFRCDFHLRVELYEL